MLIRLTGEYKSIQEKNPETWVLSIPLFISKHSGMWYFTLMVVNTKKKIATATDHGNSPLGGHS